MTPDELFDEFTRGFENRKFPAGLLIAFIDLFRHLGVQDAHFADLDDFLAKYPRQTTTSAGKPANTLIVQTAGGKTLSLRPFYNAAERYFRAEEKRFDYPSCAPHATQAWADYRNWLDALVTYSDAQLVQIRERVRDYVLARLPSQAYDAAQVEVSPPLFRMLLEEFDLTARPGEPTGAPFQGFVFGFLRADNPHLQVEIDKVRTGPRRLQRVGDIDAWEGARLAISAEVKQYRLKIEDVPDVEAFANETGRRGALGLVVALEFGDGVRDALAALGVRPLDLGDLLSVVELWDPLKQRTAVSSVVYYVRHVEKNASLAERVDAFLRQAAQATPSRTSAAPEDTCE
jgi:hypothetical protein